MVVNEFAGLGIDQHLIDAPGPVATLANGCFCCRDQGDLAATLTAMFAARRAGQLGDFDLVVIEASGLADPSAVAMLLAGNAELGRLFELRTVVACVDATRGAELAAGEETLLRQIALADVVAITKSDLAGADLAVAAEAMVAAINPAAAILPVRFGAASLDSLLALRGGRSRFVATAPAGHGGLGRGEIVSDQDWDWQAFSLAMQLLGEVRGPDLLRVKGLLRIGGRTGPVLYQRVGHLAHPPVELPAWPDGVRRTRLAVITRDIPLAAIEALIGAAMAVTRG